MLVDKLATQPRPAPLKPQGNDFLAGFLARAVGLVELSLEPSVYFFICSIVQLEVVWAVPDSVWQRLLLQMLHKCLLGEAVGNEQTVEAWLEVFAG